MDIVATVLISILPLAWITSLIYVVRRYVIQPRKNLIEGLIDFNRAMSEDEELR